ncbi:MAG: glycosyltransferase [Desulfuromonadaceae bacterium]
MNCPTLLVIEPNLRTASGHYADFVRAIGSRAEGLELEVYAHPDADTMLANMSGVRVCSLEPRVGARLAEWQTIFRAVREDQPFLVLTADGRHAAAVSLSAARIGCVPTNARLFFHRPPTTFRDKCFLPLADLAREHALAITPTEMVADALCETGWKKVVCVPYPILAENKQPQPEPFSHLLMAGAARVNKGLDLVAELAVQWAHERRNLPLSVQVSQKHADRHGHREGAAVRALLSSGYQGLRTDATAPDRAEYLARFRGALVLAPYAREQFSSQVSGVVLDALLHGTPVIATRGTWPGDQVERFGAGVTIAERTPAALATAIDRVLSDWATYNARACASSSILAQEHDPIHLLQVMSGVASVRNR